jgi:hypothetical protein
LTFRVNQSLAKTAAIVNCRSPRPPRLIQIDAPFSSRLSRNTPPKGCSRIAASAETEWPILFQHEEPPEISGLARLGRIGLHFSM